MDKVNPGNLTDSLKYQQDSTSIVESYMYIDQYLDDYPSGALMEIHDCGCVDFEKTMAMCKYHIVEMFERIVKEYENS